MKSAKRLLTLVASASLAVALFGVANAAGKSQPAPAMAAKTTPVKPPAAAKASGGGPHEGITVHGHWVIEVKNPDGSLVRHLEFENSIDPGFSAPFGGQHPGGASLLSAIMAGQASTMPSALTSNNTYVLQNPWGILLANSALSSLGTTTTAPCAADVPNIGNSLGACLIIPSNSADGLNGANCSFSGVSCNLSVGLQGAFPNFTGFQLSGSVVATQAGNVSTVATIFFGPCADANAPSPTTGSFCSTSSSNPSSLTSSTNFPGAPITVANGQTIAVTVTISFQ
jgi:hypothetical protein